jgi:AmmeMemoRadiSam system protein B
MNRRAAVAGTFYPQSATTLEAMVERMVDPKATRVDAVGLISPHAGYIYSGPVAGAAISRIKFGNTFVIMGPNHTGMGVPFSLWSGDSWETPLGMVEIDNEMRNVLLENSSLLQADTLAHTREHSIEVQLPFLQYFKSDVKIVPIVIGGGGPADLYSLGLDIARAIGETGRSTAILASSDMTHYEPQASAERKDKMAIDAILKLDADSLVSRINEYNITMCGFAPALALISAAKELGSRSAELVRYQTSGDTSGDYSSVVGYAGIIIEKG